MKPTRPHRSGLAAALIVLAAACAERAPVADTGAALTALALRFVEPSTIDLGASPTAVVVVDLDGDGHPDLAAATGANGVAVALSRDGGFAPPCAYPAGNATHLVAGDFDGDGKVDLVVTNEGGIGVLLGKGDGTFGPARSFATGGAQGALVSGDFDGNGKLDVAVADTGSGRVMVLLGKGDGSFGDATPYATLQKGTMLVAGDVDGDGTTDLVVVAGDGSVLPLFGKGDGTLRSGTASAIGRDKSFVASAAGDFNGDGKLDLVLGVVLDQPGFFAAVDIALGNGDGTFRFAGSTGGFNHSRPSAIAVGDLDGDGKLDVVADVARGGAIVTALGKGDGTLGAIAYHRAAGALVAVADVDGDGKADVLAARRHGVAVSAGNGDGTLCAQRAFKVGGDGDAVTGRMAVGDFNRDGVPDVVVLYNNNTRTIGAVLLGDGRGGLRHASGFRIGDSWERSPLFAVDLDGDGVPDLVVADEMRVLMANGDGSFRSAYMDGRATALAFGDFDGDGKPDAVVRESGFIIMPGKGDGTFAKDRQFAVPVDGGISAIATADLDGDGHTDMAVSAGGSLVVLLGNGDGSFAPAQPVAGVPSASNIVAADLDGDGLLDLVAAHVGEEVSTVLLNTGGGVFRVAGTVPSTGKLRVADMDGDGIPDLLVHGGVLVVYRGLGDGTFEAARVYAAGGTDFGVGDFDGDGKPDVAAAMGGASPFVSVLRNASR